MRRRIHVSYADGYLPTLELSKCDSDVLLPLGVQERDLREHILVREHIREPMREHIPMFCCRFASRSQK
jgi:hypothetical protein